MRAVSIAERLSAKKESLPVLSCVLIEAAEHSLTLRATNLEAGIEVVVPATIDEPGTVAIPATIFSQTLRLVGGDQISLKTVDSNLSLESRGSKNLIKATPHDEFPSLSRDVKQEGFGVGRVQFLEALQAVMYAASPSMIRPELGSVYVSIEQGQLVAVATDSFRLAEKKVASASKKETAEFLIPLKHVTELAYVLERLSSEEVRVIADDSQCVVSGDGVRFISRLVEARFPNYREVIPKTFVTEATLLKGEFQEMLRKARVFSGTDQHVGFHIYPKRSVFSATARSAEVGEMSDSIEAALTGDDLDINFHIGYLSDCLSSIRSDSVVLGFAGSGKSLVVRGASDASFCYLVMPLNR